MARHRPKFTFREELFDNHWAFNRVSNNHRVKAWRRLMLMAIPFSFDEEMAEKIVTEAYGISVSNEYEPNRVVGEQAAMLRLPETREIDLWRWPIGVMWIEFETEVYQFGMLYFYAPQAQSPITEPMHGRNTDLLSQQGQFIHFSKKKDNNNILTVIGGFAFGDEAVKDMSGYQSLDPHAQMRSVMLGTEVNSITEIDAAFNRLTGQAPMSRRQHYQQMVLGSWVVLPIARVLNEAKTTGTIFRKGKNNPSNEMSGNDFTLIPDVLVRVKCGLQDTIRIRYQNDYEGGSGRRVGQHPVRGFYRKFKAGRLLEPSAWIWVKDHYRGDPSLGIKKRTYQYEKG